MKTRLNLGVGVGMNHWEWERMGLKSHSRSSLVENRRLNLPHLYLAPPSGVTPLEFCRDLWHQKTRRIALSYRIKISPVGSLN